MAKRRKVSAPSADDLNKIEEEFRRETLNRASAAVAPISQVAADAAQAQSITDAEERAEMARDRMDAAALRDAKGQGRIITEISVEQIMEDAIVRDRTVLDPAEMDELKLSIRAHGLRLPIEVFDTTATPNGARGGDKPFGLLSGYRRLYAVRELYALTGDDQFASIKALVRDPDDLGGAFSAMVEENEIRASLSHFERGRIAVIAAKQGVFANTEDAVAALFASASKAKRSKIRSFSLIFEELGDMLEFPESLKERDGLRVAAALRNGAESRFRDALAAGQGATAADEWAVLEQVLTRVEDEIAPNPKRGGRPKSTVAPGWDGPDTLHLSSGVTLHRQSDSQGHFIRIKGKGVDQTLIEAAMTQLQHLFEK